ncbi:hypothetical protein [Nocardiopsis sp. JB363]|uniref:hypothetical protein n=1 Tax=Nocardiopsis sp. JB363 TaxID=1434837 RepID=UPI00097B6922|nr:hypothetical protein [Nocardiopsis sp. JB363]SIO89352.1 hypothetical protein BQ8420_21250 [Nocardiopsis sp. JB363]
MLGSEATDLLSAVEDALRPPTGADPGRLNRWHSHTLRHRLPMVREALRIVRQGADLEPAIHLLDQAIADHSDSIVLPQDELPIPERALCDLLHRHWAMTVEGRPPNEKYVAYRPFDWQGEGDRFERVTAFTRTELLRRLAARHPGIEPEEPGPSNTA